MSMDVMEQKAFVAEGIDISEKLSDFRNNFKSAVTPEKGSYGITRVDKGNGLEAIRGKNDSGHPFIEYYQDGKLTARRESLGNHRLLKICYDDACNPYLKIITEAGKSTNYELAANAKIIKGNFCAVTDAYGRTISTKVTDITLKDGGYHQVSKLRDKFYLEGDEVGHGVPDQFGGPASKENTFAQAMEVNRGSGSKIRMVESLAARLKQEGHTVDYEMRATYSGNQNARPTSFEPHITVDGKEYNLPENLRKIDNTSRKTVALKSAINGKEGFIKTNEVGLKSGVLVEGITYARSSADNISACINGEISGEEAAVAIVKDISKAGGADCETSFVSTSASEAMKESYKVLLQRIGNSCLPKTAVVFAFNSIDSIIDYAKGDINENELAYELGDSAAYVTGGFVGGAVGAKTGAALGTVMTPGVGSVVGGIIGTVVAFEVYATAVETGNAEVKALAEKAEMLANDTIDLVKENMPDKVDEVKSAFNDFTKSCNLPFCV